jgi:hypothetical protein
MPDFGVISGPLLASLIISIVSTAITAAMTISQALPCRGPRIRLEDIRE